MKLSVPLAVAALLCISASAQGQAQTWPAKPIRNIMSYAGGPEPLIRLIDQKLGEALGQPVVLESQPAANGAIAAAMVARAEPDGYTILSTNAALVSRRFLVKDIPWDPLKDFTPVRHLFNTVGVIVAHPSGPASLKDMIETARRNPGGLSYGSAGIGSTFHLAGEQIQLLAGVKLLHVPFKGAPAALNELIAGRIQTVFSVYSTTERLVEAGKARYLATLLDGRYGMIPEVPSVKEVLPGYRSPPFWGAYLAPAGLPRPIVQRLHDEISKAMASADVRAIMDKAGLMPGEPGPEKLAAMMKSDVEQLAKLVKLAGIRPE